MHFKFSIPTIVECERGISIRIGEILHSFGYTKALLVTDPGIRKLGLLEMIETSLSRHLIDYDIYDEIEPNPSAESIMRGLDRWKSIHSDCIVAIGGGSSIDTAKGIAMMTSNPGHILDYEGVGKLHCPGIPLIAIPTTAGTGSEVTASTIVTNTKTQFKAAVISPYIFPKLALLDSELTVHLPQQITASTGMDALTHAIESYTSKTANPMSQAMALHAVRMIGSHLMRAYYVGTDLHSRENMLIASMIAGAAFSQSRLGNVHAISHTLGGVFNIPHGVANATLLPYVMKYNLPACPDKMKEIAAALGEDTQGLSDMEGGEMAIQAVIRMNNMLHIPTNIMDLGVTLDAIPKLVEDAMRSGNVLVNPRLTGSDDIRQLIEHAYHGTL